jgi:hypothetical protein
MPITKLKNGQLPDTISSKTINSSNSIYTNLASLSITGGSNGQVLSTNGSGTLSWISLASGDIDLGTFYDFGTFDAPSSYNLDLGAY